MFTALTKLGHVTTKENIEKKFLKLHGNKNDAKKITL